MANLVSISPLENRRLKWWNTSDFHASERRVVGDAQVLPFRTHYHADRAPAKVTRMANPQSGVVQLGGEKEGSRGFIRSQELLGLRARHEAAQLLIGRVVLRRIGRTKRYELFSFLANKLCHVLAMAGRHVSRSAVRAIVVRHARPFVGPISIALGTPIVVQEPGHRVLANELLQSHLRARVRAGQATATCNT